MPRISCANHKINLVVKSAIKNHKTVEKHLKILNNFIKRIRNTIELNKVFADHKCRLRLENSTRWGSGFLMLERIKKAFVKGLFNTENYDLYLPVPISIINTYLKILKPIYLLNVNLQRDNSSIGEIIPAVLNIINKLEDIQKVPNISTSCKNLCELLISEFKKRFNYELNSEIYQVIRLIIFKCFLFNIYIFLFKGCIHFTCFFFKILGK